MPVNVSRHPIVAAKLSELRLHDLSPREFREGVRAISSLLMYEASQDTPLRDVPNLHTPIASFTGHTPALRVGVSPILRSGTGMIDAVLELFPEAKVYHLGLYRDRETLQAVEYYSKLPSSPAVDLVYVLDPLIATGGTAVAALGMLTEWGLSQDQLRVVSVLGSTTGVEHVNREFPGVKIFIGAVDEQLTDKGYILPGVGDAGDRLFNTLG